MFNREGFRPPSGTNHNTTETMKKIYQVEVKEILRRVVEVEASCANEAERQVRGQYWNSDIVLTEDDFEEVEINTLQL